MFLEQATAEELDRLALLFSVYPKPGENPAYYRERVMMHMRATDRGFATIEGIQRAFAAWKIVTMPAGINGVLVVRPPMSRFKGALVTAALWVAKKCGAEIVN